MASGIKIRKATTLIVGDNELRCNCDEITIDNLTITDLGLSLEVLKDFDLIIYSGVKGLKLIKSKWTGTGVIK